MGLLSQPSFEKLSKKDRCISIYIGHKRQVYKYICIEKGQKGRKA